MFLINTAISISAQQGFDLGISGTFENTYIWRQNNYGTLAVFQTRLSGKAKWPIKQSENRVPDVLMRTTEPVDLTGTKAVAAAPGGD